MRLFSYTSANFLSALILFLLYVSCKKEKLEIAFSQSESGTEKNIYNVFGLTKDTLFACGGENQRGFVLQSTDGGKTWRTLNDKFKRNLHSVFFVNALKGFCGSDSTNIFFTNDGGNSWSEYFDFTGVPYQYRVPLHKIFFSNVENAFAVGGINFGRGIIYHSNDTGTNWHTHGFDHEMRCITQSEVGIFSGGYGTIVFSNDNENWKISNSTNEFFTGMVFISNYKGFACGYDGGIYKTTDAGNSWSNEKKSNNSISTTRDHFLCADFFNNTIVMCGLDGIMAYSTDGGENWETGKTFNNEKINALKMLNQNKGIAVGNNGKIFLFEL